MVKQFYINGTGSGTYGVYISSDTFLDSPSMDFTAYEIPARNGSLISYNKRLNNVIRKFDCYIKDDVNTSLNGLKRLLYSNPGYMRIESDYDPDTYQEGYLAQDIKVDPFNEQGDFRATFSIYFSCKPGKFAKNQTAMNAPRYIIDGTVIDRNDAQIKSLFDKLAINVIPNDTLFIRRQIGAGAISATNMSVSWSGGACFCAVFETGQDGGLATRVIAADLNAINGLTVSFTSTSQSYVIWGFRDTGNLLCTYTYSGASRNASINSMETNKVTSNGTDYTGSDLGQINLTMAAEDDPYNLSGHNQYIVCRRYLNNNLVGEGIITIKVTDLLDLTGYYTRIYSSEKGEYERVFNVIVDTDTLNCYIAKENMPNKSLNKYTTVQGDFEGICDKVTVQTLINANFGYAYVQKSTVYPGWYRL